MGNGCNQTERSCIPRELRFLADSFHHLNLVRHVSDAGCFASDGEVKRIGLLDVSGRTGRHAIAGQSYRSPPRSAGMHGRRGGDASTPNRGQNAGRIQCRLSYAGGSRRSGVLALEGSIAYAADRPSALADTIEIGTEGYLFLRAVGGRGGNGGRGGDGQPWAGQAFEPSRRN